MADPRLPFNTPPALLGAAFFLALAALLAEVVGFRLCAATFGADLALLLALSSPAVGGLGATLLASRSADRPPARVAVSAARMATAAGVMVILLVVTVTWRPSGRRVFKAKRIGCRSA